MNKLELLDKQKQIQDQIRNLINTGENEIRKLNESEETSLGNLKEELEKVEKDLGQLESEERKLSNQTNSKTNNKRNMNQFNLFIAVKNHVEKRQQPEIISEVMEIGRRSFTSAGTAADGQIVIPYELRADVVAASNPVIAEQKFSLITPLKANLAAVQAGATFLTGLVNDYQAPTYSGSSAQWEGETDDAADGAGTFGEVKMKPLRLSTYIDISRTFLAQDAIGAEQELIKDLTASIAAKLESTLWGKAATATGVPDGFFTGTPSYTVTGAADWAKIVAMETACDTSNALTGNLSYITHPSLVGKMKSTAKASGQAIFLTDGKELNGYPVYKTTHMSKQLQTGNDEFGIIFGNWADLVIGSWGGVSLTFDEISLARSNKIRIVVNAYFNFLKKRDASFVIGTLK